MYVYRSIIPSKTRRVHELNIQHKPHTDIISNGGGLRQVKLKYNNPSIHNNIDKASIMSKRTATNAV